MKAVTTLVCAVFVCVLQYATARAYDYPVAEALVHESI